MLWVALCHLLHDVTFEEMAAFETQSPRPRVAGSVFEELGAEPRAGRRLGRGSLSTLVAAGHLWPGSPAPELRLLRPQP